MPSVATAGQLLNSESINEKPSSIGKFNIKESTQATAWVEEIILLDPP